MTESLVSANTDVDFTPTPSGTSDAKEVLTPDVIPLNSSDGIVRVAGNVDVVVGTKLKGWAIRTDRQDVAACVSVYIDDVRIATVKCNEFRPDLRDAGIRGGFAGFEVAIPSEYCDGISHNLRVIEEGCADALPGLSSFSTFDPRGSSQNLKQFYENVVISVSAEREKIERVDKTGKVAIFCSYFDRPYFSAFHEYLFDSLRKSGYWVLSVHSLAEGSPPPNIPRNVDCSIIKQNLGYDFGSWLTGIHFLREKLPSLQHVIFINDSVFGPLCNFSDILVKMESDPSDFWGLIDSFQHTYHLQSFCLGFKSKVLRSGFFESFASSFSFSSDKAVVIQEGELAITDKLSRSGFTCSTAFKYEHVARHWVKKWRSELCNKRSDLSGAPEEVRAKISNLLEQVEAGIPMNPTHLFWDSLIDLGFPFIKRELLFKNPMDLPNLNLAKSLISAKTNYEISLIEDASRFFPVGKIYL